MKKTKYRLCLDFESVEAMEQWFEDAVRNGSAPYDTHIELKPKRSPEGRVESYQVRDD